MSEPPKPRPRIGIAHGWRWFTGALGMLRHWPTVFPLMGLILACLIALFPVLTQLVLLIVGPALIAGMTLAAHTAATGGKPNVAQLVAMFQRSPRRGEAIKLCVPLLLANVFAALVLIVALTRTMAAQGVDVAALEGQPQKLMAVMRGILTSDAMHPWWLLAVALVAVAWTFTALAIPRVALTNEPAFHAMGESLRGVWGHIGAWIVAVAALLATMVIVGLVLQLTRLPILMEIGALTAGYALIGPMFYLAWRDLGGAAERRDGPPPTSQPPAPPPPSGIFEA